MIMKEIQKRRQEMSQRKKAFTLIELLVVIAIIALLLTILTPALRQAKKMARDIVCKSNLHQWGIVFTSFFTDNDGHTIGWPAVLHEYYSKVKGLRYCPEAPLRGGGYNLRRQENRLELGMGGKR